MLIGIEDHMKSIAKRGPDYGVVQCDGRPLWEYLIEGQFIGMFMDEGEVWKTYRPFEFYLPTDEELKSLKGLLFSGSYLSAHDTSVDWIGNMNAFIKNVYENYPHVRMYGGCFGHQAIANALGGRSGRMEIDTPVMIYRGQIQFREEFYELPFVRNAVGEHKKIGLEYSNNQSGGEMFCLECHGDEVKEIPPEGRLLASSAETKTEVYMVGNRVLCTQAHPDFTSTLLQHLIVNRVKHGEE